jgi:hypothetical protein
MIATFVTCALLSQEPLFPTGQLRFDTVRDFAGRQLTIPQKGSQATVLLFIAIDCPISNRLAPEIKRIVADYSKKDVAFLRAYSDSTIDQQKLASHGKEFGLEVPGFLDVKHRIVKAIGVTVVPTAAVIRADGTLAYRGRINDLYLDHGTVRDKPTRDDLRIALDEVLLGKPVSVPLTRAIGCDIPDLD